MHEERHVVVQVGKCNSVLGSHWLSDDDLVNVIEFIPIVIARVVIFNQGLKLRTAGNRHVESFGCEETLRVEQVEEVFVDKIGEQLISQTIKSCHLRQR